jgi:hypothetical protein
MNIPHGIEKNDPRSMDPTSAPNPRLQTSQLAAGATAGPGHGQLLQVGLKCWAILGMIPFINHDSRYMNHQ